MINKSKEMVINAIYKVVNSAPKFNPNYHNGDITIQEFTTWFDYAIQILNISYNHLGFNNILLTKEKIIRIYNQYGVDNISRVYQICEELLNLAKEILNY